MGKSGKTIIARNTQQAKRVDYASYKDREMRLMAGTPFDHWALSAINQSLRHGDTMTISHTMSHFEVERRISACMNTPIPIMRLHPWFIWAKHEKILSRDRQLDKSDLNLLLLHYFEEYEVEVELID